MRDQPTGVPLDSKLLSESFDRAAKTVGLFLDANLLVLWVVGNVNPRRIEAFKRTSNYSLDDFLLLSEFVDRYPVMRTAPHVLAEAGNLTDLKGHERRMARMYLKDWIGTALEFGVTSRTASEEKVYERLGLSDAAITRVAGELGCAVLTDDLDLYIALSYAERPVINFNHVREQSWR